MRVSSRSQPRQDEQGQQQADHAGDQAGDTHAAGRWGEPPAPTPQVHGREDKSDHTDQERHRDEEAKDEPQNTEDEGGPGEPVALLAGDLPTLSGCVAIWTPLPRPRAGPR